MLIEIVGPNKLQSRNDQRKLHNTVNYAKKLLIV